MDPRMKVTLEIDPTEIEQIVCELAAEQTKEILKRDIADRLRDNDEFWDLVDEAAKYYLHSESFAQLIKRVIHNSESELTEVIRNRILDI
jgi:hypothetical protein